MFKAIESKSQVWKAYKQYRKLFSSAPKAKVKLGWAGGNTEKLVEIRVVACGEYSYWVHIKQQPIGNRFWCCFGYLGSAVNLNDIDGRHLSIDVEINPPCEGSAWNISRGAFAKDSVGNTILLHTGGIGGGKKGVGKNAFLEYLEVTEHSGVVYSDGRCREMLEVANLSSPSVLKQIGKFVSFVRDFKRSISVESGEDGSTNNDCFTPEFGGKKKGFKAGYEVSPFCEHGLIVGDLVKNIRALGLIPKNDQYRDAYCGKSIKSPDYLFEVKSSADTQSIYTAVGQLKFHGGKNLIAVLPSDLKNDAKKRLESIGVDVVTYDYIGEEYVFKGLSGLLESS